MKISEFWRLMTYEFGEAYSKVLARDLVLPEFGHITAQEALDRGEDPKAVWLAICVIQEVPEERRWGPDLQPRR